MIKEVAFGLSQAFSAVLKTTHVFLMRKHLFACAPNFASLKTQTEVL